MDVLTESVPGSQAPGHPVPRLCAEDASAPACLLEHRSRDPAREAKQTISSPPGCHHDVPQLLCERKGITIGVKMADGEPSENLST